MKTARIAVLGIAVAAGLGAAFLASGSKPPESVAAPPPPPPPPALTDDVLVAAKQLNFGTLVDEADLRWEAWPKDHVPDGLIRKSASPGGIEDLKGSCVRSNFAEGDPLRLKRLVKDSHCGSFASELPPGRRAVAINIDTQGSSTAGGFILPNNRVDVVHTFVDARNAFFSEIILSNVRVLAIGQVNQDRNGEHVITGATVATLELTPTQAETIVLAQRTGQLSLILRGMTEAKTTDK